jgi:hypothetical protein
VIIAVLDELLRMVTAVTVDNQEPLRAYCICVRVLLEVLNPRHRDLILGVAYGRHRDTGARVLVLLLDERTHHHLPRQDEESRAGHAGCGDGFNCGSRLAIL